MRGFAVPQAANSQGSLHLEAEMQRHQLFSPSGPLPEIEIEGNAGKFPFEVQSAGIAVDWSV